jgi:hypothetical protein
MVIPDEIVDKWYEHMKNLSVMSYEKDVYFFVRSLKEEQENGTN